MTRPYHCPVCDSPLMQTSKHHSTCPEGHTGLHGPLPKKVRQLNHAQIVGVPVAVQDRHDQTTYLIDGVKCRRVRIYSKAIDGPVRAPSNQRVAIFDGEVILFEVDKS